MADKSTPGPAATTCNPPCAVWHTPPMTGNPAGNYATDADLTIYWPDVRPEWEESRD